MIKVLRLAANINQKEFARELGISSSYLSLIESNGREPGMALLRKISRRLGVPISVFFYQAEENSEELSPAQQEERNLSQEVIRSLAERLVSL